MSKAKWAKGRRIRSLDAMYKQERIFWNPLAHVKRHVVDAGWFNSWQLQYAAWEVRKGHVYTAKAVTK